MNLPMALWKFIFTTVTLKATTALCLGGYVYRIAVHLKFMPSVAFDTKFQATTLLHTQCLLRSLFLLDSPLRWRYLKDKERPLPCDHLPALTRLADSYLLEGEVPSYHIALATRPPPRPHALATRDRPSSSRATEDVGTSGAYQKELEESGDDEDVVSTLSRLKKGMSELQLGITQILANQARTDARLAHLEENMYRASFPIHDFAYRAGLYREEVPTPTWYTPHDRFYEISLAHGLDRIRVGRRRFNNFTPTGPRISSDGRALRAGEGTAEGGEGSEEDDERPEEEGMDVDEIGGSGLLDET